ncbi:prolyl oligopeptidase family serine peptidase [uncultured Cohaesibacter sp.]|uniref:prolyl oligopeptidase family serine peptidase n=1 Tax=uncultured Cohaesibacter sp. TaxID=1002546 RepID=UPI0029C917A3|nr:prolyl oligopeptidase family serine peptidase [uncultured Cohaesibacter sp.]
MDAVLPFSLPFAAPLPVIQCLAASEGAANNYYVGDWPDRRYDTVERAELHSFKVRAPKAQALVYAGGGYTKLMYDKEGVEVALWLNGLGIDAHILVHRLPGAPSGTGGVFQKDIALADGKSALKFLEATTGGLPLFHVGLSSGGHLAGVMACQGSALDVRGALMAYAPLNANHRMHKYPEGKPDYEPVRKQDFYDDWAIGLEGHGHGLPHCPLFLAYALQDRTVPVQHALNLLATASRHGVSVDAHIFGTAPHGFALRDQAGTHALWPQLASDWFDRQL